MLALNGQPAAQALAPWHDFYQLLGEASATLIGLLFVAASIGSGVFRPDRPAPLRIFLSASVVHFSSVLAACLTVLAPIGSWTVLGIVVAALGLFGLAYAAMAWRDTIHDGIHAKMAVDDRLWYAIFPLVGYLIKIGSGIMLALRLQLASTTLALSIALLLMIGVHNAWDITVWSMTRRRQ
jgi:hypothetical protein